MESVVVTITDMERSLAYDLELPCATDFNTVRDRILDIISMIDPGAQIRSSTRVIDERDSHEIDFGLSVEDNCIWNGDYLVFI